MIKMKLILWLAALLPPPLFGLSTVTAPAMEGFHAEDHNLPDTLSIHSADDEKDSCQVMAVNHSSPQKGTSASSGGRGGGGGGQGSAADDGEVCIVCSKQGATKPWKGKMCHIGACLSAARCHVRQLKLLPPDAREKDDNLLKADPATYTANVSMLLVAQGATRSQALLDRHYNGLHASYYADSYTDKQMILLTKRRFICYQRQWEGENSSDASYSFDNRLDEASTDNTDSDGEPQVAVKTPTIIGFRSGNLSTVDMNQSGGGGGGGDRRSARQSRRRRSQTEDGEQEVRGRRRSTSEARNGGGRRRRGDSGGAAPPSHAVADRRRQPKLEHELQPESKRVRVTGKAAPNGSSRAASRKETVATAQRPKTAGRKATTAADDEESLRLAFLKNKKVYKKEMETTISRTTTKGWIGNLLVKRWTDLEQENRDMLEQSRYDAVMALVNGKVQALKNMMHELCNTVDASTVADWMTRRTQAEAEYDAAVTKVEKFLEEVKEMRVQESVADRAKKAAVTYQRTKFAGQLEAGGFAKPFSLAVTDLLRADSVVMVITEASALTWDYPMVFEPSSAIGNIVGKAVDQYMSKCENEVSGKVKSLAKYLQDNPGRNGAMVAVPNTARVPDISKALELPGPLLRFSEPGSEPWIAVSKPHRFRFGPSMFPNPGIGSVIKKVGTVGCTLVMIPVSALVKAGIVVLSELPAVLATEAGCKVFSEHAQCISWSKGCQHAVWIPYGWIPMHISSCDETHPSYIWSLPLFEPSLAKAVPEEVWAPTLKLSLDHAQKMSGEDIWKARKTSLDAIAATRVSKPATAS